MLVPESCNHVLEMLLINYKRAFQCYINPTLCFTIADTVGGTSSVISTNLYNKYQDTIADLLEIYLKMILAQFYVQQRLNTSVDPLDIEYSIYRVI